MSLSPASTSSAVLRSGHRRRAWSEQPAARLKGFTNNITAIVTVGERRRQLRPSAPGNGRPCLLETFATASQL